MDLQIYGLTDIRELLLAPLPNSVEDKRTDGRMDEPIDIASYEYTKTCLRDEWILFEVPVAKMVFGEKTNFSFGSFFGE